MGGNKSSRNSCIEPKDSRYHTCNKETILEGDKNDDPNFSSNNDRCGMPEDMLFEILPRLPVTPLLRFRSVCKYWRALIDSSTFVTRHLDHNRGNDKLLAFHWLRPSHHDYTFCLLSGSKYEVYRNIEYEPQWHPIEKLTIIDSCNGIVCLGTEETREAALWNPATKQLRPLPESPAPSEHQVFGFGFDAKGNDYKVVKLHFGLEGAPPRLKRNGLVEVYSLRNNSWKIIQGVLPCMKIFPRPTLNRNGKCFWIGPADLPNGRQSCAVVSFDLNDEMFETVPLPGEEVATVGNYSLDILGDKLVYINGLPPRSYVNCYMHFEVWELDEDAGRKSWSKLYSVGAMGGRCPLGFSKNGELLFIGNGIYGGEQFLYSFVSVKRFTEQRPIWIRHSFAHYNESLVSVEGADDPY